MTPGLNLSRYERPLAERRLLDGAVRDRWESADRLPPSYLSHCKVFRYGELRRTIAYDAVPRYAVEPGLCGGASWENVARGDASE